MYARMHEGIYTSIMVIYVFIHLLKAKLPHPQCVHKIDMFTHSIEMLMHSIYTFMHFQESELQRGHVYWLTYRRHSSWAWIELLLTMGCPCMYVCMYVLRTWFLCALLHVHAFIYVYVLCMCACHVCLSHLVSLRALQLYTCIYVYVCVCVCICMCVYIYIYIYICTHTYIHTNITAKVQRIVMVDKFSVY